jgi:type II secretory pathway pseudopilin PulG
MKKIKNDMRKALAMIELIFAIVIMGLALMSAPILIQRAVEDSFVSYQQESVAAAAAQINSVMTRAWDHRDVNQTTIGVPILNTTNGAIPNCAGTYPPGVTSSSGRYCVDQQDGVTHYNASAIAFDSNFLDIDDFNGFVSTLNLYNGESYRTFEGDYLDLNITLTTEVAYGDDNPHDNAGNIVGYTAPTTTFSNPFSYLPAGANTSNIKLINVTLTSNNPVNELADKVILLGAFMCNIGAPKNYISNESSL